MLFNLQTDTADVITAYLVPDTFSTIPAMSILVDGHERAVLTANESIPALVAAGRHGTGLCGFRIDSALIPDLGGIRDLELRDKETNMLVYRRPQASVVPHKVLRLDSSFLSMAQFDQSIAPRFQYVARNIERYGRETVDQLFLLDHVPSLYLSGRIQYNSFARYIENGFQSIICISDPYESLAERLLVLAKLQEAGRLDPLGERDALMLKPAAQFAAKLPFTEPKALRPALRAMPDDVTAAFVDPLTRMLTTSTPDEMPRPGAVAWALDLLASFGVVGVRDGVAEFRDAVCELFGLDPSAVALPPRPAGIVRFAEALKEHGKAEHLIAKDLELYHHVVEAVRTAA